MGFNPMATSPYHANGASQSLQDAADITNELKSTVNMHVEDLLKVPIFEAAVIMAPLVPISFPETIELKNIISSWFSRAPKNIQATLFSQSHEIIICLRIPIVDSAIYVLLDFHPRDNHPDGPALTITKELDDIITFIDSMPSKGQVVLDTGATDRHFSLHCLASKPDIHKLDIKDLIGKSVAYLARCSAAFAASEHIAQLRLQAERFRKSARKSIVLDSPNLKLLSESQTISTPRNRPLDMRDLTENMQQRSDSGWQLPPSLPNLAVDNPWQGATDAVLVTSSDEVASACQDELHLPRTIQEETTEIASASVSTLKMIRGTVFWLNNYKKKKNYR
ncbi:hypothetical protein HYPSUDRAFT_805749 [Hypholoma sublateritium FD-334 SS-4]|uniref:Uncharacterized protein n=1 Tax=Hypholoma sublateritium (strain FD-334 SS-4) TaxID=945553 RepID=A0A0D2MW41_HYPSF|nr:hypothetical protein HYPSUDRAFT_805749 [Hypholoma sublateritium FD-334 SS-4]